MTIIEILLVCGCFIIGFIIALLLFVHRVVDSAKSNKRSSYSRYNKYNSRNYRYNPTYRKSRYNDQSLSQAQADFALVEGKMLERHVAKILFNLPGDDYYVLRNVYVPINKEGRTSEIDVLLLHKSGIYVFECKNYNGHIHSNNSENEQWDVSYPSGKHYSLYSPVLQNRGHIRALEHYLGTKIHSCDSWIVFGEGTSVDVPEKPSEFILTSENNLMKDITTAISIKGENYSKETLCSLFSHLYPLTKVSDTVKEQHNEDIRSGRIFGNTSNESTQYGESSSTQNQDKSTYINQQIGKKLQTDSNHVNFYPDTLYANDSYSPELLETNRDFYEWVRKIDNGISLPIFCKLLLEGSGFTAIKMPDNPPFNSISARGNNKSYIIGISNIRRELDEEFIERLYETFGSQNQEIIVVVSPWQFSSKAIHAAKKYGFVLWDSESLRNLTDYVLTNGSLKQLQNLKEFINSPFQ